MGVDLHVDVPSVETQKLIGKSKKRLPKSKDIQKRVQKARDIQTERFKSDGKNKIKSNSEMNTRQVKKYCKLSAKCKQMMLSATASLNLSARSYFKVVKIARTIADLEGVKKITTNHLAEALQYRPKDKEL